VSDDTAPEKDEPEWVPPDESYPSACDLSDDPCFDGFRISELRATSIARLEGDTVLCYGALPTAYGGVAYTDDQDVFGLGTPSSYADRLMWILVGGNDGNFTLYLLSESPSSGLASYGGYTIVTKIDAVVDEADFVPCDRLTIRFVFHLSFYRNWSYQGRPHSDFLGLSPVGSAEVGNKTTLCNDLVGTKLGDVFECNWHYIYDAQGIEVSGSAEPTTYEYPTEIEGEGCERTLSLNTLWNYASLFAYGMWLSFAYAANDGGVASIDSPRRRAGASTLGWVLGNDIGGLQHMLVTLLGGCDYLYDYMRDWFLYEYENYDWGDEESPDDPDEIDTGEATGAEG